MIVRREFNRDGSSYWLAVGEYKGTLVLAEGGTRREASHGFASHTRLVRQLQQEAFENNQPKPKVIMI